MKTIDHTLENLIELNGERIIIDESHGLWVEFEIIKTQSRQQGIKYSLTLHDKSNKKILGFDNSHEIKYGSKRGVSPERVFDHWHYDENDEGRPYNYTNAGQLLEDFGVKWTSVLKLLRRVNNEQSKNRHYVP